MKNCPYNYRTVTTDYKGKRMVYSKPNIEEVDNFEVQPEYKINDYKAPKKVINFGKMF